MIGTSVVCSYQTVTVIGELFVTHRSGVGSCVTLNERGRVKSDGSKAETMKGTTVSLACCSLTGSDHFTMFCAVYSRYEVLGTASCNDA